MPGIAGIVSKENSEVCSSQLDIMSRCLNHESFHVSGKYIDSDLGVYSSWTSIEGSLSEQQPIRSENGNIVLIQAGEIFPSDQSTPYKRKRNGNRLDWVFQAYEAEGPEFIKSLNGLFSGLLIDKEQRKAFLFNDRYGIQRIYYKEMGDSLYFASEAKALLALFPETRAFDGEALVQYLTFGCTLEWKSLFSGITLLPGASIWTLTKDERKPDTYFSPKQWEEQSTLDVDTFNEEFKKTFHRILPRYFESDIRTGISLTGGLDTRMIMACLPQVKHSPICYTYAEENNETTDARIAQRVASACGLDHTLLRFDSRFYKNFIQNVDKTIFATDGCFGSLGTHEIFLSRLARECSPIRITGNFGSEILRDMSTFKPIGLASELFDPEKQESIEAYSNESNLSKYNPISFATFQEIPWSLFGSLASGMSQIVFRTPYLDNDLVELAFRAPKELRTSPRTALNLISSYHSNLSAIPTDKGVSIASPSVLKMLNRIFCEVTFKADYIYNEGLPHAFSRLDPIIGLFNRRGGLLGIHKYLHYRVWFRTSLASQIREVVSNSRLKDLGIVNSDSITKIVEDHIAGKRNYLREIGMILTLDSIQRQFFKSS